MTKLAMSIKKSIKILFIIMLGLIIVCFLVVILEAMIGDFLWHLFSGDYINNFEFLGSFIQLFVPTIVIFFCYLALFRPSVIGFEEGTGLFSKGLGFSFLAFPEDLFYREKNIFEKRKCRYLIFYRDPHCVRIFGNDFLNLDSFFSDHILSIGKTDIFLYKALWIILIAIIIIDSLFNTAVTTPVFEIGMRLMYEICLIALILALSAYLSYMTWRKYIIDHSSAIPKPIFHGKFISLHLSTAHTTNCIFICPFERFNEFDKKRAERLCDSFLRNSGSIYNGKVIDLDRLKEWAANENI